MSDSLQDREERSVSDSLSIELDPKVERSNQRKHNFIPKGLSQLPLDRKIDLISGLSFAGLMTSAIAGGVILYSSLTARLLKQNEFKLIAKSQIVELLTEEEIDNLSVLDRAVAAITEDRDYTAVYLPQDGVALTASSLKNDLKLSESLTNKIIDLALEEGTIGQIETIEGDRYALAAKTFRDRAGRVGVVIHASSFDSVYGVLKSSLLTQAVLSISLGFLIFCLSKILAVAIARQLDNLQQVVENFVWGNWQARSVVNTADKIGTLSNTLNVLADSLEFNEVRLRQEAERSRILKETAFDIALTADVAEVLQITVNSARKILLCDRVIYQNFDYGGHRIIAESVDEKFASALGLKIDDFLEAAEDRHDNIAIANIDRSELPKDYLEVLKSLTVAAILVVPVVIEDDVVGWLIAHQCSEARIWQDEEINLLSQMAFGVGRAIEKIELLELQQQARERERLAKENLQRRALELLMEVDPVSQGDLTVQVKVKEDEIGTIADSYNATIENLRKLVAQVKTASIEVSSTTSEKDRSIQELSTGASAQTLEINTALQRIQGITDSISAVAKNAKAAEAAMLRAVHTVRAGDDAMTQTVEGFQEIRDTVAATAKKVKRLGESSQKISKVVSVISNFAEQTNLLALNASIEAAHAGEQGRGFAVVADEVRSLARQSASATAEIEALVAEIQMGTKEVVAAMEEGTQQVVAGTKLVDKTRFSLIEIADVSQEIDRIVAEIAVATVEQSRDSEVVSQTMKQVAAISDKTATEAGEVSASFKELLAVAQQLKDSVAKFKVN